MTPFQENDLGDIPVGPPFYRVLATALGGNNRPLVLWKIVGEDFQSKPGLKLAGHNQDTLGLKLLQTLGCLRAFRQSEINSANIHFAGQIGLLGKILLGQFGRRMSKVGECRYISNDVRGVSVAEQIHTSVIAKRHSAGGNQYHVRLEGIVDDEIVTAVSQPNEGGYQQQHHTGNRKKVFKLGGRFHLLSLSGASESVTNLILRTCCANCNMFMAFTKQYSLLVGTVIKLISQRAWFCILRRILKLVTWILSCVDSMSGWGRVVRSNYG